MSKASVIIKDLTAFIFVAVRCILKAQKVQQLGRTAYLKAKKVHCGTTQNKNVALGPNLAKYVTASKILRVRIKNGYLGFLNPGGVL